MYICCVILVIYGEKVYIIQKRENVNIFGFQRDFNFDIFRKVRLFGEVIEV